MNTLITRNTWCMACASVLLALATSSVQAASFDCAKARTKVEHIICDTSDISKLDEELAASYKVALQDKTKADSIKQAQKLWMKGRNACAEEACVQEAYRNRIKQLHQPQTTSAQAAKKMPATLPSSSSESYTLLMSKDDELCNHMLQLFNEDLNIYGWQGDEYQEEHEEFKRVPWRPARFSSVIDGRTEYTDIEGALFDFNNDGVQDFVVRWKASLSGMRADSLDIFQAEVAKRADELKAADIGGGDNTICLASWWYSLPPPLDSIAGVRVLEPFIYQNKSYLVMRPLFETPPITSGYAAITKYGGGKFINRELTGKMEDVCYYRRNRAQLAR